MVGALAGALSNQKEGGKDTGNLYSLNGGQNDSLRNAAYQSTQNDIANGLNFDNSSGTVNNQVQNSSLLGGLYGQGGTLQQTEQQAKDLSGAGFQLTDSDRTAYGQASGDIARMFGQNDNSLAQSLSDRGLSSSGAAGQAFSSSLGNKNEQLAGLQTQIAQNRMQMNQQRLAQTQNFLGQLAGGAQNAFNSQSAQNLNNNQARLNNNAAIRSGAQGLLSNQQNQNDTQLQEQQATQHGSTLSNAFGGANQMVMAGIGMAGGMASGGAMPKGQSGYSMPQGNGAMAGQSYNQNGNIA